MKKLLTVTTILCALTLAPAYAHDESGMDGQSVYLERALDKLPHEQAENFRDALQEAHEQSKDLYAQVHQLREDMHKMLTAPEFDQDAFLQKTDQMRQLHDQISAKIDQAFAYGVADLSQADRKKLADALERTHEATKHAEKAAKSGSSK